MNGDVIRCVVQSRPAMLYHFLVYIQTNSTSLHFICGLCCRGQISHEADFFFFFSCSFPFILRHFPFLWAKEANLPPATFACSNFYSSKMHRHLEQIRFIRRGKWKWDFLFPPLFSFLGFLSTEQLRSSSQVVGLTQIASKYLWGGENWSFRSELE